MSEILPETFNEFAQENNKDFLVIWFESVINTSDEIETTKDKLQNIYKFISLDGDNNRCINYIASSPLRNIFLILSGKDGCELLTSIQKYRQLHSVFIFPEKSDEYDYLTDKFDKIVKVCSTDDELLTSISNEFTNVKEHREMLSFYNQQNKVTQDLSEESTKFLWLQLLKDVILHLPHTAEAKKEMIKTCRQYYQNDQSKLRQIDLFNRTYQENECITWYTNDAFIYRFINKALRTEDIEQLYIFRFYIRDLSNELKSHMTNSNLEEPINLYRGTIVSKKDIAILKANEGELIAINSYWSTSRKRSVALIYAGFDSPENNDSEISVLFEIKCNLANGDESVVFADITDFSEFKEEEEVLFDIGAVFKIEQINEEQINDKKVLIVVQISASGEGRKITENYIEQNRREMEVESPTIMLSTLLKRLGKFDKSLRFLENLLENPGNENKAHIHNRIGIAYKDYGIYDKALIHFGEAFKLTSFDKSQRAYAAFVLHNQGMVYAKKRDLKKALTFYQRAISDLGKEKGFENSGIAQFYSSIGRINLYYKNYIEALNYQSIALKMREKCLSPGHVIMAFSYADIAKIHLAQEDYDEALIYHQKALELRQKQLPPEHHSTAWSLHQVGNVYYKQSKKEEARKCYLKALEIKIKCESISFRRTIPQLLKDIAMTYNIKSEEGLDYELKALEIQEDIEPIDYSILAHNYQQIAHKYKSINRLDKSLRCYQKVIELRELHLSDKYHELARSLYYLASIYEIMENYKKALECYMKQRDIYINGIQHSPRYYLCLETQNNIDRMEQFLRL